MTHAFCLIVSVGAVHCAASAHRILMLFLCLWSVFQVRVLGDESSTFKYMLRDSSKWEVARPPNEVRRHVTGVHNPTYNSRPPQQSM